MPDPDLELLISAIRKRWPAKPTEKAERYLGQFFDTTRFKTKIAAKVVGNHGTYAVSIYATHENILAACSCYIGKHGGCHHCQALAWTFLQDYPAFKILKHRTLAEVEELAMLPDYLRTVTLEELIHQLKSKGVSQKAFAESLGMSSQKLSAIKSSERRNRYFHELGALKLACLWVLQWCSEKE